MLGVRGKGWVSEGVEICMETIVGLIVLAVAFYILKGLFSFFSGPKVGDYFICSTCGKRVRHSPRTISALKMGLRRSVCGDCHSDWVEAQQQSKSLTSGLGGCLGRLGCLGVIALIAIAVVIFISSN